MYEAASETSLRARPDGSIGVTKAAEWIRACAALICGASQDASNG
jgi:hypothetical protein